MESGDNQISHVTNNPSKQSTIGDKYTFPAGIANSVISVNHLLLGFSAEKSLFISFGTDDVTLPAYELYLAFFLLLPPVFLRALSYGQSSQKQSYLHV